MVNFETLELVGEAAGRLEVSITFKVVPNSSPPSAVEGVNSFKKGMYRVKTDFRDALTSLK